jgi:hypothetical protein
MKNLRMARRSASPVQPETRVTIMQAHEEACKDGPTLPGRLPLPCVRVEGERHDGVGSRPSRSTCAAATMACSRSSGPLVSPTRTAIIALFFRAGEPTVARFLAESAGRFPGELQTPRTQPLQASGAGRRRAVGGFGLPHAGHAARRQKFLRSGPGGPGGAVAHPVRGGATPGAGGARRRLFAAAEPSSSERALVHGAFHIACVLPVVGWVSGTNASA